MLEPIQDIYCEDEAAHTSWTTQIVAEIDGEAARSVVAPLNKASAWAPSLQRLYHSSDGGLVKF